MSTRLQAGFYIYSGEQNLMPAFMELPFILVEEKLAVYNDKW